MHQARASELSGVERELGTKGRPSSVSVLPPTVAGAVAPPIAAAARDRRRDRAAAHEQTIGNERMRIASDDLATPSPSPARAARRCSRTRRRSTAARAAARSRPRPARDSRARTRRARRSTRSASRARPSALPTRGASSASDQVSPPSVETSTPDTSASPDHALPSMTHSPVEPRCAHGSGTRESPEAPSARAPGSARRLADLVLLLAKPVAVAHLVPVEGRVEERDAPEPLDARHPVPARHEQPEREAVLRR